MGAAGNRQACIVGVGETAYTKRGAAEESEYRLALRAVLAAVADAGLTPADVDGFTWFADERSSALMMAGDLGVRSLRYASMSGMPGGGGPGGAVMDAVLAVEAGLAEVVVAYRSICIGQFGSIGRPRIADGDGEGPSVVRTSSEADAARAFASPFGLVAPALIFALPIQRHMARYGTTSEHLGHVAVAIRDHAVRNPRAVMVGRPLTLAEHQASRMIADPYRLFDCCLETDGACAVVVTTRERAVDAARGGALVVAGATGSDAGHLMDSPAANSAAWVDRATTGGMVDLAGELWARAGVGPGDIDVAQLYDNFTGNVLLALEDFGFCEPGASGPFAASGALRWPDGALPTNTAGGNLSEGYLQGMNHVVEGVRQIRGESTAQVDGAELCLVTSSPGIPTSAVVLGAM